MRLEDIFPYDAFRPGQRQLASAVYEACKVGRHIAIEAMSGFGKTAAVLSGAVLAAQEDKLRIIYACRTKRQVLRAIEETQRIQKRFPLSAASLYSKLDYCLLKEDSSFRVSHETFKWYCDFNVSNNLCSYYLNIGLSGPHIDSLVSDFSGCVKPHSVLMKRSKESHVCPYEIARLCLGGARLIVTTYHYLLHAPSRSIILHNAQGSLRHAIAIIDEAHNIRDFVRDNNTRTLSFAALKQAPEDIRRLYLGDLADSTNELASRITRFCSSHESWHLNKRELVSSIRGEYSETWLADLALQLSTCAKAAWYSVATGRNLPSSILEIGGFLTELLGHLESTDWALVQSRDSLQLTPLNQANLLNVIGDTRALVLVSATMSPVRIFLRSVGLSEDTLFFRPETNLNFRIKTLMDIGVTTRFRSRNEETYARIIAKIKAACNSTIAGVGVFAPSYSVLEPLYQLSEAVITDRKVLRESRQMTSEQADAMMNSFKSHPSSVLFAVQGGKFSEGEDFPGDEMEISIVVGLSLSAPSPVMYAEYASASSETKHQAWLRISLLPALRRAFQSAGRHVRNPGKRGMVLLLDARFNNSEVIEMMPSWLKTDMQIGNFSPPEIEQIATEFLKRTS